MLYDLEERVFALPSHNDVNEFRFESLLGKQRWMPAAENYRKIWIPCFDGTGDINRLANHRTRDQGNRQTDRVFHFVQNAFFEIWRNRGINQLDGITSAQ